jgi:hypothetical protein
VIRADKRESRVERRRRLETMQQGGDPQMAARKRGRKKATRKAARKKGGRKKAARKKK